MWPDRGKMLKKYTITSMKTRQCLAFNITEMTGFELDSSVSLVDFCEHSDEQLASVKYVKFLA
jgi:hypothetical protein